MPLSDLLDITLRHQEALYEGHWQVLIEASATPPIEALGSPLSLRHSIFIKVDQHLRPDDTLYFVRAVVKLGDILSYTVLDQKSGPRTPPTLSHISFTYHQQINSYCTTCKFSTMITYILGNLLVKINSLILSIPPFGLYACFYPSFHALFYPPH